MPQELAETENSNATRVDYSTPPVNLRHESDAYVLEVDMPGVPKNGVEIVFDDGKLTLTGHRAKPAGAARLVHSESSARDYRRVFTLDPAIDPNRIEASMDQGLLTLRLQKTEAAKPRRISVN
ncbi:MAG: Hsp20/alpha crystallin family protein [Verrucomicrobia bacterium]|nr:Hsp20/alpha crystallin family protein [Verrucomicrobiota bacterium]